jgi:vacuolar-type H+-ATPase subunit F/Vma7
VAHLAVLSNRALGDGFRLAGLTTIVADPGEPARTALRSMVGDEELGLLLVTEDLWGSLTDRERRRLEYLARPLVQAIPAGRITEVAARRELLGEMLERAIGYRIQLGGGTE